MIKKNFKLLAILFVIITLITSFTFCFAEETNETASTTDEQENTTATAETSEENIHEGDLYLFDTEVTMDQLVDGNVYIMANKVTISGQINGNLFVIANSINFNNCYVRYSIYACANNIYYDGACNDFYAIASKQLEMTYDSYVIRDVKASAKNTIFRAAIGRDVDLQTNSIDFGLNNDDQKLPIIYGNLRYSANNELQLPEGIVEGNTTYNPTYHFSSDTQSISKTILNTVCSFLLIVITSLVIYALLTKLKPGYVEELNNLSIIEILKAIGIGLLTIFFGIILSIILIATSIGAKLGLILIVLLILLGLLSMPIVSIYITNLLKPILKIETTYLYYLILALVSIVLYGLTLIPFFIGGMIGLIITLLGYGLLVSNFLPKKDLSEEEIQANIVLKEEQKAEKAKLKENKKAEKAKLKESKKSEKDEQKENKKSEKK